MRSFWTLSLWITSSSSRHRTSAAYLKTLCMKREQSLFELLAKAPSEAWVGLIGAIVGAAIGLFGSWLTSKSSIKQLRVQLEHEERVHTQNVKRERFEELYILLGHWLNAIFSKYLHLTLVMKGEIDYNQYLDTIIENGEKQSFDFQRIEMIINIYGKELRPAYENVLDARTKRNDIESKHKAAYRAGEFEAGRFLKRFSAAQLELEDLTEILRKQVADAAAHA